jgi:hypothetical protein
MMDRLAKAMLGFSLALAGFLYAVAVYEFEVFPYSIIRTAERTITDLRRHWKNDLGIEPTRQLARSRYPGDGVTANDEARSEPGLTLLSGFFDGNVSAHLIEPDGTVVHSWVIRYTEIFPKRSFIRDAVPLTDWNVFVHGIVAQPDGSIVFNFDAGAALVKMTRCGEIEWKLTGIHHSVFRAEDGTFWVPLGNNVAQVSPAGKIIKKIKVETMVKRAGLHGILYIHDSQKTKMHPNDVEVLSSEDAAAFPLFAAGDVVYSMRDLNLIIVFDPETEVIKWYQHGPWLRQHDPDFLPDGRISIFDNRMDLGASAIVAIDPVTREQEVLYEGTKEHPFYTGIRGKHQHLANGNILITETHAGRVFEVTADGEVVWEYVNRYDDRRVGVISKAIRYPRDFFTFDAWACEGEDGAVVADQS